MHPHSALRPETDWTDLTTAKTASTTDLDLTQPQTTAVHAYWLAKRAGRSMPGPRDINPAEIKPLLPYISMSEVLPGPPVDYLYRIDGEAVRSAVGFVRTGHRLSEFKDRLGPAHDWLAECYGALRANPVPRCARMVLSHLGRSFYVLELVYLPLSEDGTTVQRILQALSFVRKPEDEPVLQPPAACS